jgi:hypothetical protein
VAIVVVQSTAIANKQAQSTITFTLSGVTAGNAILVPVGYVDGGNSSTIPLSCSDGTAYTADKQPTSGHSSANLYSLFNVAAGTHTIVVTKASAATAANVGFTGVAMEVSGLPATNSLDANGTGTNTGNSTAPSATSTGNPSTANSISIGMASVDAGVTGLTTPSQNGGWTNLGVLDSFPSVSIAYLIGAPTNAQLAPTYGTIAQNLWAAYVVTYTPAALLAPPSSGGIFVCP